MKGKHVVIRFPHELHRDLKTECARRQVTMQDGIELAFKQWAAGPAAAGKKAGGGDAATLAAYAERIVHRGNGKCISAALTVMEALAKA